MAPMFSSFRQVRKRMKRTLNFGQRDAHTLNGPLTEMIVDYFDSHSPYDYMDLQSSSNISRAGLADPCTMVVAMVYLDRLRIKDKAFFEASEPTDLYLPALILASKFLHDADCVDRATNCEWAEAMNISTDHVNNLEWAFIKNLDWNVNVKNEDFETWLNSVEKWVAANSLKKHDFSTYNELFLLLDTSKCCEIIKDFIAILGMLSVVYTVSLLSIFATSFAATSVSRSMLSGNAASRFMIPNQEHRAVIEENCPSALHAVIRSNNTNREWCLEDIKKHININLAESDTDKTVSKNNIPLLDADFEKTPLNAFIQFVYS